MRTELIDEIARLNPAEVLISELSLDAPWVRMLRGQPVGAITVRPSWDFQPEQARKTLYDQFGTTTLAGFGIDDRSLGGPGGRRAGGLPAGDPEDRRWATSPAWSPTVAPRPWRSTR